MLIKEFQALETDLKRIRDFVGNRVRMDVTKSVGSCAIAVDFVGIEAEQKKNGEKCVGFDGETECGFILQSLGCHGFIFPKNGKTPKMKEN